MQQRQLTVLGATGSIGRQALSIIEQHSDQYGVFALCANRNVDALYQLCLQHKPRFAVMADEKAGLLLRQRLVDNQISCDVLVGYRALEEVAQDAATDIVVSAMVGAAGLLPTMAALQAGKQVLLANKESLVMAGGLMMDAAKQHNATLLPVDSEHNAIFQALPTGYRMADPLADVASIVLTASGGPLRTMPLSEIAKVTPEQALAHPCWSMGPKISIDSATMMNKGLEVIEAHWLFGMPLQQIEVVIHPQSIIHSLVRYHDGSMLAQMGVPDMRIAISYALGWPARIESGAQPLDLIAVKSLEFAAVELERYPCLQLAYQALQAGGVATVVLNAANEVAVQAFLDGQIAFGKIAQITEEALSKVQGDASTIDEIMNIDRLSRRQARNLIGLKVE